MDTHTRDFIRKNRPPFDNKHMEQFYCEQCQTVFNAHYRQLFFAHHLNDDRRARFLHRKWKLTGPRMQALWPLLEKTSSERTGRLNVTEEEQTLLLELIDDLLMMRRCMKPLDIWMAIKIRTEIHV